MALSLWTTKDQTFILISSLRVNMLFYVTDNSYRTIKSPHNIKSTISTWFSFRDWTKIQDQSQLVQTSLFLSIPLVPKIFGAPTRQQVLFLRRNTFPTQFKIPRNIMHKLSHNDSKNLRHVHPFPCVGPYKNTCNNSKLFLTFLAQQKSSCQDFSHSICLIKFCFYFFTTPQNQTTFF